MIEFRDPSEDLIKHIRPHDRQDDFLAIPNNVYEALYGGAAYGGKSFILTLYPLIKGYYKYRGFKGIILRRKFPDLEREIIRLSKEYYPLTGAVYNETKHSWEWKEYGSYMDFGHCQHESDITQYDGYQVNYCAYDELTHFTEYMYQYMVGSRVRPGSASINVAIVRNATNPGGIGQTFCYNRFVKPCEDGYKLIHDKKTELDRIYIPCLPQDNPYGMAYDPQYLQKLEILSEADKRAKKYGDWHAFEGSVFPEFRPIKFSGEPDNALHVITPFVIPEWWPKILSIDWGKRAMCHAMWAAISPDNRVYVYRERTWLGKDVPFWASEVGELSFQENIVYCILCGSAWQERGTETIAAQFERYSHIKPHSSDNSAGSRVAGVQLVHEFLRWQPRQFLRQSGEVFYDFDKAQWIFRNYGEEAFQRYNALFKNEEEFNNLPRLQFFNTCTVVIETIPTLVHDDKNKEDVAEFDGDDPWDNLRYLCKAVNRFCYGETDEIRKRKQIQEAIVGLQQTGDQTSFYRRMENMEVNNEEVFGVRRHYSSQRRIH